MDLKDLPVPKFQTLEFDVERFVYGTSLDPRMVENMRNQTTVKHFVDERLKRMFYEVRTTIVKREVDRVEVKYPSGWWQAVKERFAPDWVLSRWPVRYTTVELCADALYPTIPVPESHPPVLQLYKENDG